MKKGILVVVLVLGVVAVGLSVKRMGKMEPVSSNETLPVSRTLATPTGEKLGIRVADDDHERELGLSYFKSLPKDEGMLFLFDEMGHYPFWMKGMNFPLDIIWLRRGLGDTYMVVYVAENVDPLTYPSLIDPKTDADAVLEINAGSAAQWGIRVGAVIGQ